MKNIFFLIAFLFLSFIGFAQNGPKIETPAANSSYAARIDLEELMESHHAA